MENVLLSIYTISGALPKDPKRLKKLLQKIENNPNAYDVKLSLKYKPTVGSTVTYSRKFYKILHYHQSGERLCAIANKL